MSGASYDHKQFRAEHFTGSVSKTYFPKPYCMNSIISIISLFDLKYYYRIADCNCIIISQPELRIADSPINQGIHSNDLC